MKKEGQIFYKDGYILRLSQPEDAKSYYQQNFAPLNEQVVRFTGCKAEYTHDEVVDFFMKGIESKDRYDFLIIAPDGRIIGESVINDIDWESRSANYRIAIFHPSEYGKGIGSWAVKTTRDFAFEQLRLHRLELSVYSFNTRAENVYLNAGFKREGVLRGAVWDGKEYSDEFVMSILEDEWRQIKEILERILIN